MSNAVESNLDVNDFRIGYQGKQLSQIVAYIWRWIDSEDEAKAKVAKKLKTYFARPNEIDRHKFIHFAKRGGYNEPNANFKRLLSADPRAVLNASDYQNKVAGGIETITPNSDLEASYLLIKVFGEARINNDKLYLSPMFSPAELGDYDAGKLGPYYKFIIDVSSFIGTLQDPSAEEPYAFRYLVAFPPRPELGVATVTQKELVDWVNDETATIFPNSIYIPVSTT